MPAAAHFPHSRQRGFTLIEVMIAVFVLSIGLLGVAALQLTAKKSSHQAWQRAQAVLTQLASLPISVDRHPVARSELLALSLRFGLSTYDAAYLELALRLQCPIATRGEALLAAAMAAGVGGLELK